MVTGEAMDKDKLDKYQLYEDSGSGVLKKGFSGLRFRAGMRNKLCSTRSLSLLVSSSVSTF